VLERPPEADADSAQDDRNNLGRIDARTWKPPGEDAKSDQGDARNEQGVLQERGPGDAHTTNRTGLLWELLLIGVTIRLDGEPANQSSNAFGLLWLGQSLYADLSY
jgi:hypothetical protein